MIFVFREFLVLGSWALTWALVGCFLLSLVRLKPAFSYRASCWPMDAEEVGFQEQELTIPVPASGHGQHGKHQHVEATQNHTGVLRRAFARYHHHGDPTEFRRQ
jgi:hypothetical protein